jgi:hypothetical protein
MLIDGSGRTYTVFDKRSTEDDIGTYEMTDIFPMPGKLKVSGTFFNPLDL